MMSCTLVVIKHMQTYQSQAAMLSDCKHMCVWFNTMVFVNYKEFIFVGYLIKPPFLF